MKITQLKLFSADLQLRCPELRQKKALFYFTPVDRILRGIYLDSSRWNGSEFNVNLFFQPLYVPSENINLTNGFRLMPYDKSKNWDVGDSILLKEAVERIATEGLDFLNKYKCVEDVLMYPHIQPTPISVPQDFSYSLAASGRYLEAANYLECGARLLDVTIEWQKARKLVDLELASLCKNNHSLVDIRLKSYEHVYKSGQQLS